MAGPTVTPSALPQVESCQQVEGMTIFFLLITFVMACCLHPLSCATGFAPRYRHYVRVLPLSALLDDIFFIIQIAKAHRRGLPLQDSLNTVIFWRFYAVGSDHDGKLEDLYSQDRRRTLEHAMQLSLNPKARILPNGLIVLAFVKAWSFHGVLWSQILSSVYFFAWFGLESILLIIAVTEWSTWPKPSRRESFEEQEQRAQLELDLASSSKRKTLRWASVLLVIIQLVVAFFGTIQIFSGVGPRALLRMMFVPLINLHELLLDKMLIPLFVVDTGSSALNQILGLYWVLFIFAYVCPIVILIIDVAIPWLLLFVFPRWVLRRFRLASRYEFKGQSLAILGCMSLLIASAIYYAIVFTAKGTAKSAWSDRLG